MTTMTVVSGALCALVFGVVGLVTIAANGAINPSTAPVLATSAVPIPALIPVLDEAGSLCPGISAPLLASQIDAESDWNPSAVSPDGAEGIAQFLPATFPTYERNDDGTENVSPFSPVDAVMAMGRYDCALLADFSGLTGETPASFMLAAYNAGVGAVLAFKGIPPYPETEAYVAKVESLVPIYTASLSSGSTSSSFGQMVVAAATGELGVPYSWGGGNASGPTVGIASGANTIGFDCSGLVLFAVAEASSGQIVLPHSSELQAAMGTPVAPADIQPGDVIAFALGADPTDFDHIGIYIGNSEMIDAPDTGAFVRVDTLNSYWQGVPSVIRSFG
ncbi:MAG: NlpC/P60 family protein [Acidimicrobiales bacterium]